MRQRTLGVILFCLATAAAQPPLADNEALAREFDEVARVATVMIDGDTCRRIVTPRALEYFLKQDPRDPWVASDNYDVNHEAFIQTKKTLIRLARLARHSCDVNLWMPLPTTPRRIHVVIRNANELSQYWTFGALHQEMPPEMEKVLETGERITVRKRPGMVSVLAPVFDSLGDIVGLVEVVGRASADPQENVR